MMRKRAVILGLLTVIGALIIVTTSCAQQTEAAVSGGGTEIYMPFLSKPVDLAADRLEITQATQTSGNSVQMIANRSTFVRFYSETVIGATQNAVMVSITGSRGASTLGTVSATVTVPKDASQDDISTTANFLLPDSWLSGDVSLVATVDSDDTLSEVDESNNSVTADISFQAVPDVDVVLIPINYTHEGTINPGFYPAQSVDNITDWIMRAYPIDGINLDLTHAPYDFSGNLQGQQSWIDLLNDMFALKLADGLPGDTPTVYYAFVPIENGADQWFFGGIAGVGWISHTGFGVTREAVGLNLGANDDSGILAGHEIGHNFGRFHAPCGGAAGPDPDYPYENAIIGQYGLDIDPPFATLKRPDSNFDMMSYCSPEWMSDYTYDALREDQVTYGFGNGSYQAVDSLMIRAAVAEDGSVELAPMYAFSSIPTPALSQGAYRIELLDSSGQVVARHIAGVRVTEEEGIVARAILANIPLPVAEVASVRIVHHGEVVGLQSLQLDDALLKAPMSLTQTDEAITLDWDVDAPVMIRYSADNGASWQVVGLDVEGGNYVLNPTELAGGQNGRFEVIFGNTAVPTILMTQLNAPLPDQTPVTWVNGPTEITNGDMATLYGYGNDKEDGVLQDLTWYVDGEFVKQGSFLQINDLAIGEHIITLEALDQAGQLSQTDYVVTVHP